MRIRPQCQPTGRRRPAGPLLAESPVMTKDELVKRLDEDLAGEFQAVIMYVTYAASVTGPHRPMLKQFFGAEIPEELMHAQFLAEKIASYGGTPVTTPRPVPQTTVPRQMLENVLAAGETGDGRLQDAGGTGGGMRRQGSRHAPRDHRRGRDLAFRGDRKDPARLVASRFPVLFFELWLTWVDELREVHENACAFLP